MRSLHPDTLAGDSTGALMARSSDQPASLLVGDERGRVVVARWRRRHAVLREPHVMTEHLLSYCLSGSGETLLEIDGQRRTLRHAPGFFVFVPAGATVRWQLDAGAREHTEHLHLYVSPAVLGAEPARSPRLRQLMACRDRWMDHYVQLLQCELQCCGSDGGGALSRSGFLDRTGALLLEHLARTEGEAAPQGRRSRVSPLRAPLLARIDAHLAEHLHDEVPLPALAALVHLSVDHFVRAFQLATGTTPHQYLLARRLERAGQLLRESPLQVAEVARECGFASPAHFSALFHRRHGVSPSDFRRLC